MSNQILIKAYIEEALQTNNLAVLATEGNGQPHACFIAITPMEGFTHLIFATYRSTRKYNNLINNGKVAILFEDRSTKSVSQPNITVLTAFGLAKEVSISGQNNFSRLHLLKHPEMESFLLSDDCAIFQVRVEAYQLVQSIDDISWWIINEDETNSTLTDG